MFYNYIFQGLSSVQNSFQIFVTISASYAWKLLSHEYIY